MKTKIVYEQYGGKSSISSWIISHFPPHKIYLEPFCGSCSVLFAKEKSFIEIVNDLDGRIVRMYECLRSHPEVLASLIWATPYTADNWRDGKISPNVLEDARLLMAQKQWYCGNGNTSTWAIDKCSAKHKPKSEVWADWFRRLLPAAQRLKSVQILHEDGIESILRVYQDRNALIYVDPPYFLHEKEYRERVNYEMMVAVLKEAKAKVVISEYKTAHRYWRDWISFRKETAGRARTGAHNTKAKSKVEMLYTNF